MAPLKLFYSYSHTDETHRKELVKHLTMLQRNSLIDDWFDGNITAGSNLDAEVLKHLESADIVVFLVTENWLSSNSCIEEWDKANEYKKSQPNKRLIPIIVTSCAWQDLAGMNDILALPHDGKPVIDWPQISTAWTSVYEGIRDAAEEVKKNFKIQEGFLEELNHIEFCSTGSSKISLREVFVFPNLKTYSDNKDGIELPINTMEDLISNTRQFVIGDSQSGKTKLCSWIYLELNEINAPCIYIDLAEIGNGKNKDKILKESFIKQQTGDFEEWCTFSKKYIFFDNLTKDNKSIELIQHAEKHFTNIIICSDFDTYNSYYNDDERFCTYKEIHIDPFCHRKQESLIKNWLAIKNNGVDVNNNLIDSLENNINSIIIDNKILPRFPFFILSILQTYESFMPENLKITAYGHCYNALIVARLIKSGINQEDNAIESAFTFCTNFAYKIYTSENGLFLNDEDFERF